MRYILVGANPFRGYTGTLTYTSLKVIGSVETLPELRKLWDENYSKCGGLMLMIDLSSGKEVDYSVFDCGGKNA